MLEFADTLRADEVLQRKARSMPNIEIIKNAQTTEVRGDGSKVVGLTYKDRTDLEYYVADQRHIRSFKQLDRLLARERKRY